ncbi:hypothetical protein H2200_006723 [Cladophialophora chaetospira]|uniref:SANT domain-containing protein n=1 Tax=Cladophialophora chaetospira TaxID=386627 RepID=A0AA39CHG6_9EURO|nr:hypothetical protein H2200_006723 [Cladophialophora chaetospira]
MSSRYPPPARDRSPPRYERRPSSTAFTPSSQRDPPRGPKADFRGGGNFGSIFPQRGRGGGFPSRPNDTWDRERERERDRDRPGPPSYRARDDDRADWPRRDRDFPPADRPLASTRDSRPYVGRERSASPVRSRRDSRESIPSNFSRLPDSTSSYYAPAARGGLTRGRGRGDWDRGRGRNSFVGDRDRDLFQPRSRSRESWRDRDFDRGRPTPGDTDRPGGYDRRDYDRSREREVRVRDSREHDIWQRPPSPARTSTLNTTTTAATPSAPINDRPSKSELDTGRRTSVVATPSSTGRDNRRDGEPSDYFGGSRPDPTRRDPPQPVQQPAAAVGLDYGPPPSLPPTTPAADKPAVHKPQSSKPEQSTPAAPFQPPSGPKAGRTIAAGVPSGPRITNVPPYNQRIPSNEPTAPPSVPREAPKPAQPPTIPTAPRGMLSSSGKLWLPPDRAGFTAFGPRQPNTFPNQPQKSRSMLHAFGSPVPTAIPSGPKALIATSPRLQEAKMTLLPPRRPLEETQRSGDVDMSSSASSADEDEAEDDSFDEEYFQESEERHKQEMKLLEARKPPTLLEDPTAVALLVRLQFLEMISRETVSRPVNITAAATKQDAIAVLPVPTELPVPQEPSNKTQDEREKEKPDVRRRPLKELPVNPIPTPPIESLPYLRQRPSERVVFDESDNEVEHEAVSTLLQQEFEREAWDLRADLEEKHAEFKFKYSLWRQEINLIEQERREQQASPAPASPAPSAAPSVTPSLTHERTRGARNTTEADLEAALALSKQSAKEEEERREREAAASSLPNYDMEAVIPPMLTIADIELSQFEDTNNLIPHNLVKYKFAYWPPVDDFTDEEQESFITAYCQTPKKWSKIAESIPGRTYQDCIAHYYLTKDQFRYKEIFKRSQPKKRRGKAAAKPRSTALLSELQRGGDDGEGTHLDVTVSGRPRRAAAPTFGDAPAEVDPSTPLPQSKKLTAALSNPDTTAPKTSRGRKTGSGTKPRRTKAQMQADQQQAMLLAAAADASPGKSATGKAERARTILRGGEPLPPKADLPVAPQQRLVEVGLQPYTGADIPLVPAVAQAATASSVTSYWSVPEQHKFPELLAYFGRDFAAIADFMKTKSVTMIKNYYLRQLNDGKDEFEKIAQLGEQRRMAGETIPQPPSPIAPAKRRYDTTPSNAPTARTTIHPDHTMADHDPVAPSIKPSVIDEYPQASHERTVLGDAVNKPRTLPREMSREVPVPGSLVAKTEEVARLPTDRIPLFGQKPHGPKSGFFQDDVGSQAARQAFRPHLQEQSPQILAQRLPELARNDLGQQQSVVPAMAQSLLGQREPLMQTSQRNQVPPPSLIPSLQSQAEKYPQTNALQSGHHSRNSSLVNLSHAALESPQDLSSLRRVEDRRPAFGSAMSGSPALKATSMPISQLSRPEVLQPSSTPAAAEPPKPPVKRSNVFGLLNDDPPDPPPKRPTLEAQKRSSILSPQVAHVPTAQNPLQQTRGQLHSEDLLAGRMSRGPFGHSSVLSASGGQHSSAEYAGAFPAPSGTAPSNDLWMDRFDPRTQGAPGEHRGHRHSPAPSQYSLVPPGSQPPALNAMRVETSRGLERPGMDHRRALMGQMNQLPHAPSPPPQQPMPPLRSASSSSQHSRGPSLGYPGSQQPSQTSSLGHTAIPQTHPQSASSTPVSSLHHRAQSSLSEFPTRLTIQQHMAQQTHQKQQEQQREHERQVQRQRELEVVGQRDHREREREREHQQQQMRREIYGIEHHPSPISRQNQLGATANQSHMAFAQREIPRTFTPPHAHGHSHSHSHSPFGGPVGLGGAPGLQHQLQHGMQHQQQPQQQPGGPLHQGLQHPHHAQLHPGGHSGHFRGTSQGDARRDGRG